VVYTHWKKWWTHTAKKLWRNTAYEVKKWWTHTANEEKKWWTHTANEEKKWWTHTEKMRRKQTEKVSFYFMIRRHGGMRRRVTRLGEFLPIGRLFTLCSCFWKKYP
jgi:hypothetical protein